MDFFDSHCHLTADAFADDLADVLESARAASVTRMVTIASDAADALDALLIAKTHEDIWSTAGVHPHAAGDAAPDALDRVRAIATEHAEVVAIGETGLDFFYDTAPRDVQRDLFDRHLALGAELGLPVVVHAREADVEVADALDRMPQGTRGVLHCFTGGPLAFERALAADWYVSFSGIASFKNFGAIDFLRRVPEDRILIETDSPYLAPIPHRGKRNQPTFVPRVAEAVAGHLERSVDDVARITTENACRFYGIR